MPATFVPASLKPSPLSPLASPLLRSPDDYNYTFRKRAHFLRQVSDDLHQEIMRTYCMQATREQASL